MSENKSWQERGAEEIIKFRPMIEGGIEGPSALAACLLAMMYAVHQSQGDHNLCEAAMAAVKERLASHGVVIDLGTVNKGFKDWLKSPEGQAATGDTCQEVASQHMKPKPKEGDWLVF